jgi:hypothetical protein
MRTFRYVFFAGGPPQAVGQPLPADVSGSQPLAAQAQPRQPNPALPSLPDLQKKEREPTFNQSVATQIRVIDLLVVNQKCSQRAWSGSSLPHRIFEQFKPII